MTFGVCLAWTHCFETVTFFSVEPSELLGGERVIHLNSGLTVIKLIHWDTWKSRKRDRQNYENWG